MQIYWRIPDTKPWMKSEERKGEDRRGGEWKWKCKMEYKLKTQNRRISTPPYRIHIAYYCTDLLGYSWLQRKAQNKAKMERGPNKRKYYSRGGGIGGSWNNKWKHRRISNIPSTILTHYIAYYNADVYWFIPDLNRSKKSWMKNKGWNENMKKEIKSAEGFYTL